MGIDKLFLLLISSLATAFAASVTGMGQGMTLLALMSMFIPHQLIIPIHGIKQFFSNFFVFAYLYKHLHYRTICYFVVGVVPGALIGYQLLAIIKSNTIFLVILALMTIITAIKPKFAPAIRLNTIGFSVLGLVAAMLAPIIGAVGPLLAPFFIRSKFERQTFVSTKACCQMAVHLSKVPVFLAADFPYGLYDIPILLVIVSSYIGTVLGVNVLHKIKQKTFTNLLRIVLLIMGIMMLWKLA
ncbi:MAG: sulfite exporter TauE/SafE family protein [Pseudomonadota bacterium]|nr:sulfite exporter TauE/SafE family protein [Pseudomonadota bacterium]